VSAIKKKELSKLRMKFLMQSLEKCDLTMENRSLSREAYRLKIKMQSIKLSKYKCKRSGVATEEARYQEKNAKF